MSNEEILAGNKLIADSPFCGDEVEMNIQHYADCGNDIALEDYKESLEYHKDWRLLMPVVEKIIEIDITPAPNWTGYRIEIVPRGYVKISGFPMPPITTNVSIEGSLIAAVYKAVVQFIQWYNQQNK